LRFQIEQKIFPKEKPDMSNINLTNGRKWIIDALGGPNSVVAKALLGKGRAKNLKERRRRMRIIVHVLTETDSNKEELREIIDNNIPAPYEDYLTPWGRLSAHVYYATCDTPDVATEIISLLEQKHFHQIENMKSVRSG